MVIYIVSVLGCLMSLHMTIDNTDQCNGGHAPISIIIMWILDNYNAQLNLAQMLIISRSQCPQTKRKLLR